jgi:ParB family chromosome partitioning protein
MNAPALVHDVESLPALLARAGQRLLDARSSGEVLEAKKIAEAALALARVTRAANETHGDCIRIITRAETRMADEIDAGQERGEVATQERGRPISVQGSDTSSAATLDELGISRQRLSEWREVRDAGPDVVESAIQEALDEGRAPTKADIKRHARCTLNTGEVEWYTPAQYVDMARDALGGAIDLDPASSDVAQRNVRAARYFTRADDGLTKEWRGNIWLNPPYAQPHIKHFADKLIAEHCAGRVKAAIVLTNDCTDTSWFHKLAGAANTICFTRGRIRFESPFGKVGDPTQGQAFFYFGHNPQRFAEVFREIGTLLYGWPMT